jgi:hypothetical protein
MQRNNDKTHLARFQRSGLLILVRNLSRKGFKKMVLQGETYEIAQVISWASSKEGITLSTIQNAGEAFVPVYLVKNIRTGKQMTFSVPDLIARLGFYGRVESAFRVNPLQFLEIFPFAFKEGVSSISNEDPSQIYELITRFMKTHDGRLDLEMYKDNILFRIRSLRDPKQRERLLEMFNASYKRIYLEMRPATPPSN